MCASGAGAARRFSAVVVALVCFIVHLTTHAQVAIDWVTVANPGNAPDPLTGLGSVSETYRISKYEITNAQYTEFLNAKAASDPYSLYRTDMGWDANGGITRTGTPGSYSYSARAGQERLPVGYVTWYDAIRFVNWLNNGQGNGDTETGAYTLLGGTATPSNAISIRRNAGATVFLPSQNEWYKAAYHDPTKGGTGYWLYPTRSDLEPNSDAPPGDPSIQTNVGNFFRDDGLDNGYNDGHALGGGRPYDFQKKYLTDVGSYVYASSYYGTFDQGGNAWEWNEELMSDTTRGLRGGSFFRDSWDLASYDPRSTWNYQFTASDDYSPAVGFRVAMVPEPASGLALLLAAGLVSLRRRANRRPH